MCEKYGARVRGVIINKVRPEKLDMVRDYFGRAVEDRYLGLLLQMQVLPACDAERLQD